MNTAATSVPRASDEMQGVISCRYFSRRNDPSVRFSKRCFRFNQEAVNALEQTGHISVFINEAEKKLIVCPAVKTAGTGAKWTCTTGKQTRPQTIASVSFMKRLYEAMGWVPDYDYRAVGTVLRTQCGPILIFNLDDTEMIVHQKEQLSL